VAGKCKLIIGCESQDASIMLARDVMIKIINDSNLYWGGSIRPTMEIWGLIERYYHVEYIYNESGA
jgi:hypothetical protein